MFVSAFLVLGAASCRDNAVPKEVRGCKDISSLNYNAEATIDDGTCQYPADMLVGNYTCADTLGYSSNYSSGTSSRIQRGSFVVTKTGPTTISVSGFDGCTAPHTFSVTRTSLVLLSYGSCSSIRNFMGVIRSGGAKLSYAYDCSNQSGQEPLRGTATKQP